MNKLLSIVTVAAISALTPTVASAQEAPACSAGYVLVESAGGPLCVGAIYLDGTWNDDPRDCLFGYYQGSCAPEPDEPVWQPEENYEFQMTEEARAVWTPAPPWTPPVLAVLSPVELQLADQRGAR